MKINELQKWANNYKMGTWTKASWKSERVVNGAKCEKVSNGVIRFVEYENMESTKQRRKANGSQPKASTGKFIIKNILVQCNNGSLIVSAKTTHIKPKSTYKINGAIVDKATYETMVPPHSNSSDVFSIKLENLISLG